MTSVDSADLLDWPCYGLPQAEKEGLLGRRLEQLTQHHQANCPAYRDWLEFLGPRAAESGPYGLAPPLSAASFKWRKLVSVPDDQIVVELNSSGTSAGQPARIYLDDRTAGRQARAMNRIVQAVIGPERLPLLLVDHPGVFRERNQYSARVAAALGFRRFGRSVGFALANEEGDLDGAAIEQFARALEDRGGLIVGMTSLVWTKFYQAAREAKRSWDLSAAVLFHGGGWKKMEQIAVDRRSFREGLQSQFGLDRVYNYYGMVEQVGSIFMECDEGHFHAPAYADVIVRDPWRLTVTPTGQSGLLQVVSGLPESYPGHSLLTGDLGRIVGHDDCPCGRLGVRFEVQGRLSRLEPRGCSDTVR